MTRCRNHPETGLRSRARQCSREAGEDGFCNVCRAAQLRGDKRSEAHYKEQTARIVRQRALQDARARVIQAAKAWAHSAVKETSIALDAAVQELEKLENSPAKPIDN